MVQLGNDQQECDVCNRHPNSKANGVKLCAECTRLEANHNGDLGAVHELLLSQGLAR